MPSRYKKHDTQLTFHSRRYPFARKRNLTMTTYELLKQAILNKQQVVAMYKNHRRKMCPHTLGTKNGVAHCLFYQFGGESSSAVIVPGSEKNWRCIAVDGLTNVSVRDGDWYTAGNHRRPQSCIDTIDVEVSFR
jgi:hypothetical protein